MIYSQVRALWASGDEQGLSQIGRDPLALLHPAARALIKSRAPLSFSYDHLPLYELCQLALIWAIGGHQEKADELASRIYYLVQAFPLFGSRENQYSEKEAEISTDLFFSEAVIISLTSLMRLKLARLRVFWTGVQRACFECELGHWLAYVGFLEGQ